MKLRWKKSVIYNCKWTFTEINVVTIKNDVQMGEKIYFCLQAINFN